MLTPGRVAPRIQVTDNAGDNAAAFAAMTDAELVGLWDQVQDPENLTPLEQAVIDEMERREVDF